jgi:hypothetical protein
MMFSVGDPDYGKPMVRMLGAHPLHEVGKLLVVEPTAREAARHLGGAVSCAYARDLVSTGRAELVSGSLEEAAQCPSSGG